MTELIEKKSRFIAYAARIADETEAKAIVESLEKELDKTGNVRYEIG